MVKWLQTFLASTAWHGLDLESLPSDVQTVFVAGCILASLMLLGFTMWLISRLFK